MMTVLLKHITTFSFSDYLPTVKVRDCDPGPSRNTPIMLW